MRHDVKLLKRESEILNLIEEANKRGALCGLGDKELRFAKSLVGKNLIVFFQSSVLGGGWMLTSMRPEEILKNQQVEDLRGLMARLKKDRDVIDEKLRVLAEKLLVLESADPAKVGG